MQARLGIYGGSFDPIHFGHLRMAEQFAEAFALPTVRFIPTGQAPHRGQHQVSGHDRLNLLRLALADRPGFEVDAREVERETTCYTIDTLSEIQSECGPGTLLVWMIGADSLYQLTRWKNWEALLDLGHLAVSCRPGFPLDPNQLPTELAQALKHRLTDAAIPASPERGKITLLSTDLLDISATRLRELVRSRRSLRYLTPPAVIDHIKQIGLYRT